MFIYLLVIIMLLLSSVIFVFKEKNSTSNLINNIYIWVAGVVLIMIAGFRGGFTSDYKNYEYLFGEYKRVAFREIFNYQFGQEIGYVILNKVINTFTEEFTYVALITSIIIIVPFLKEIKKYSAYVWISVLMFVTVGSFYTSFNIIRQVMAAAILFSGSKYLYDRKLFKYFLIILLATAFHKTSLIMIPFYFLLNYRFNLKKLFIIFALFFIFFISIDNIILIIQKYFYAHYAHYSGMQGFNFKNIVVPLIILAFVFLNYSKLDLRDGKVNIWMNAVLFYAFFSILGLKVQMIQRIAEFFAPYALLIVPLIISQVKSKDLRVIYIITMVILLILYNYVVLSGSGYDPYYFFWQK